MKQVRILVMIIILLGVFIGGVSLYEYFHTEKKTEKTAEQIKKITGEEEVDVPGAKKVEKDRWSVIEGCLVIYSDTQLQGKESIIIPANYEGEKVQSFDLNCAEGSFSTYLKHAKIEEGIEEIRYGFVTCPNLETAVIPKSVKKMDKFEFKDCKEKVTLYVEKGSYAEKWAKKNKVQYKYGEPKGIVYETHETKEDRGDEE